MKTYTFELLSLENGIQKKATIIFDSDLPEDKVVVEVKEFLKNPAGLKIINMKERKEPGRPKAIGFSEVQKYRNKGFTQEETARQMNVSLSTIRRNWDIRKK